MSMLLTVLTCCLQFAPPSSVRSIPPSCPTAIPMFASRRKMPARKPGGNGLFATHVCCANAPHVNAIEKAVSSMNRLNTVTPVLDKPMQCDDEGRDQSLRTILVVVDLADTNVR